jgi:NAD(P)H dehydrogenase (quinone)
MTKMRKLTIIFHSGYGHTKRVAFHVEKGVASADVTVQSLAIDSEGNLPEGAWQTLGESDGIIFGTPTYMGGPSWQFKKFADASSKQWFKQDWKGKIAAGFTNSASINGDKESTLHYLVTLASQHNMLWSGLGLKPANSKASMRDDINYLGAYIGLVVVSPSDASVDEMNAGDLRTAEAFGANIAEVLERVSSVQSSPQDGLLSASAASF